MIKKHMRYAGLSSAEVKELQIRHGLNILPSSKVISAIKIFIYSIY